MDYIIDNVEFITELVKSGFIGIVEYSLSDLQYG